MTLAIPASVSRLILLPDNDRAGKIAAMRALAAYRGAGRAVTHIRPRSGYNDWNDFHAFILARGCDTCEPLEKLGWQVGVKTDRL